MTYDGEFHYEAQRNDTMRGDFCEPSALIPSYYGTLITTIVVYALGLQSWPLYQYTWFLSYYSWFSSVYYFQLLLYPWLYSSMLRFRGRKGALLSCMAAFVLANYAVCAGFIEGYLSLSEPTGQFNASSTNTGDSTTREANLYVLTFYLFPPFWVPSFVMGICAAFLYDAHRPYLSHHANRWGWLCDVLTCGLVAQAFCTIWVPGSLRLSSIGSDDSLGIRAWAAILSRLYGPLMVLWLYSMAVGRGFAVSTWVTHGACTHEAGL